MARKSNKTQVAVVGGGPGGYAAAFMAADLGLQVTLFDPRKNPGGICLFEGCIPSKALLHAAKLIHEAEGATDWGITFGKPKISHKKLADWKDEVVRKLTSGLGQLGRARKVAHVRKPVAFVNNHTVQSEDGEESWTFESAIVATGSVPMELPDFPDYSDDIMDARRALDLKTVPSSLLVVGGGYIGLEMGTVYQALGSRVTVVEMTPGLLPGVDRDLVNILKKGLDVRFDDILLNTKVTEMKKQKNGIRVQLEDSDGKGHRRRFEKVLVAVGRRPMSEGIGLDKAGIRVDDKGFIKVDLRRRTNQENIYAVGDVAGEPMLAHKASHEGRVAAEAIAGHTVAFEPAAIPAVVFTDPEIAWAGLTETQARETERKVKVVRFPWAASGRAATLGRSDGTTKLIIDPESELILGVGIAGPGAGELIAEGTLAIEMAAVAADLGLTIHPHPTLSETLMEGADLFFGQATHFHSRK